MKVCVLSGSPAGENSITLQTVNYIMKKYPQDSFDIIHVGSRIRSIEKDPAESLERLKNADLILFCYPVYTFLVPAQLHRFIEIMKESDIDLSGKYAAQITTSKHFYDKTAHAFIEENCEDLRLKYIDGLSADMEDLLKKKGRAEALHFWGHLIYCKENGICKKSALPERKTLPPYHASLKKTKKRDDHNTVIVADLKADDESLKAMIEDFRNYYPYKTELVNLRDFDFKGGCLGCFHCAASGECVYKDGFTELLKNIQSHDATVYAFSAKDHSMGYLMKLFDDRQFVNGHRTVTMGKPVGYIMNGRLSGEPNLRLLIEGRADVGGNYLSGVAEDNEGIMALAKNLSYALRHGFEKPATFLGVGGMKIFRDLIFEMQGLMKADHEFYKAHGFYDFPQKHKGKIMLMKLLGAMMRNPAVQKKIGNRMTEGMLLPYKKVLKE